MKNSISKLVLVLTIILAVALSGCGQKPGNVATDSSTSEEQQESSVVTVAMDEPVVLDNFVTLTIHGYYFESWEDYMNRTGNANLYNYDNCGASLDISMTVSNTTANAISADPFGSKHKTYQGEMPPFYYVGPSGISEAMGGGFLNDDGNRIEADYGSVIMPNGKAPAYLTMDTNTAVKDGLPQSYIYWEWNGTQYRCDLTKQLDTPIW